MSANKEQLLTAIERAEKALKTNLREGAKANLEKQVEQMKKDLAALEVETIKKEEKIEQKEQEVKEDLDAEIAKWEALVKKNPAPKIKEKWEAKLLELKKKKEQMAKEAKEDKAEAKQELKEVKEAVKDIEKAVAAGTTTPIKKPEIKEKQREAKSKQRIKTMQQTLSTLQALIQKNKDLKDKYYGKNVDLKRDAGRSAKPFGYRFVGKKDYRVPTDSQIKAGLKRGTIDYEARPNRSDKYAAGFKGNIREKLADGGSVRGGKFNVGDTVMVNDTGYVKYFSEFDLSKPVTIISKNKTKLNKAGKSFTAYSYGIQLADGKKPFNNAPEQLLTAVGDTEEKLTGERAGERKAGMDEFAKGGKISHRLQKFYNEAKDSSSVKDLKIADKDEFNFICKADNNCKVSIRYDKDSDTIVMSQHRKSGSEDDDISLADFKKYLSDKMADGGKLVGNQSKLDMNNNGKLDKEDFKMLRSKKKKKMAKGGELRKNSRHRFYWSKDAVKDGIIKKEQLNDTPSKHMRKKYPAYIMEK